MATTILIVDDDPVQRRLLEQAVTRSGYEAVCLADGSEAIAFMTARDGDRIALVILDLVMPRIDGMGVLAALREAGRQVPVIVQTAHGGIETVVAAMRAGAVDFAVKPVSVERLQVSIANALKLGALEGEIARIRRSASGTLTFRDMITQSASMERVIQLGQRAAASQIPILIEGESGVGKELIARAIQGTGARRAKPFITVNCGAIPDNLVESILFGHEKGAFTGANEKHIGKFQEADGGTLFLDEVSELPLDAQVKLLRALQEGEIDPIGGRRPIRVDFRLISATNRNLIDLVKAGKFREDLYYRLNVFPIRVPPLRERREDIAALARHFTARFAAEEHKPGISGLAPEASTLLQAYDWPGNIRQLENAVFRAVVLADGPMLGVGEFPQVAQAFGGVDLPAAKPPPPSMPIDFGAAPPLAHDWSASGQSLPAFGPDGEMLPLSDIEAAAIRLAVDHYRGRMTQVARRLGIGRSTLYRKLKELGLGDYDDSVAAE